MARFPATGWRWQAQPEAHSPRPQPEMTTVRPSSRTLPTWKTDGLRLLLTTGPPLDGSSGRRSPRAVCGCAGGGAVPSSGLSGIGSVAALVERPTDIGVREAIRGG